jgi:hypothetical protein
MCRMAGGTFALLGLVALQSFRPGRGAKRKKTEGRIMTNIGHYPRRVA